MKKTNDRFPASHQRSLSHGKAASQTVESTPAIFFKHMGKSLLITLLSGVSLILLFSLAAYFYTDPDQLIGPLALVASALTALIGGFAAVRIHGHAALFCGLCNGCAAMAVMSLTSLFLKPYASGYSAGIALLFHAIFLLLSVAGAYVGLQRMGQNRKKRH